MIEGTPRWQGHAIVWRLLIRRRRLSARRFILAYIDASPSFIKMRTRERRRAMAAFICRSRGPLIAPKSLFRGTQIFDWLRMAAVWNTAHSVRYMLNRVHQRELVLYTNEFSCHWSGLSQYLRINCLLITFRYLHIDDKEEKSLWSRRPCHAQQYSVMLPRRRRYEWADYSEISVGTIILISSRYLLRESRPASASVLEKKPSSLMRSRYTDASRQHRHLTVLPHSRVYWFNVSYQIRISSYRPLWSMSGEWREMAAISYKRGDARAGFSVMFISSHRMKAAISYIKSPS